MDWIRGFHVGEDFQGLLQGGQLVVPPQEPSICYNARCGTEDNPVVEKVLRHSVLNRWRREWGIMVLGRSDATLGTCHPSSRQVGCAQWEGQPVRGWIKAAGWIVLLLSLTACSFNRVTSNPPNETPSTSEPVAQPKNGIPFPAMALWGQPGQYMVTSNDNKLAYPYAPVRINGYDLQPLFTPDGIIYVRQQGLDVFLHGTDSSRGGFAELREPQLLHRLPLKVGTSWEIAFTGTTGQTVMYTVEDIETIATPIGEQLAARLVVLRRGKESRWEWWVPGHGLVRIRWSEGNREEVASGEAQEAARTAPAVGRPSPNTTALLSDDGKSFWVTVLESGKELFRVQDNYWRSSYSWRHVGPHGQGVLVHFLVPGSWAIVRYDALGLSAVSGRMEPVAWISSAGKSTGVAGEGHWDKSGSLILTDFLGYPTRIYTYRYDGQAMRADPRQDVIERVATSTELANRIVGAPPLGQRDFVAMFADAAAGEAAWTALKAAEWEPFGGGKAELQSTGPAWTYVITDVSVRFTVQVVGGDDGFQIQTLQILK